MILLSLQRFFAAALLAMTCAAALAAPQVAVTRDDHNGLHVASARLVGDVLEVTVSRARLTRVVAPVRLEVLTRGDDGGVVASSAIVLHAAQLPRRNARDASIDVVVPGAAEAALVEVRWVADPA
ncbi:MAG: hypothetical protein RLW62_11325 [Gammaproteobacteria bacterium]